MAHERGYRERFPSTHWSIVAQARQRDTAVKRAAVEQLLQRSLPALRAHLVYGRRLHEDVADDLLQEFVAAKVLEKDLFGCADPQLGRFRTFVLTALERFAWNRFRRDRAKKRAADEGALMVGEDWVENVPADDRPSEAFDKAWARDLIHDALARMREECENSRRTELWRIFECRVVGPILEGAPPADYREVVRRFGFASPTQASNALVTAKRMYARMLRAVIAEYARDEEEIESEIAQLHRVLAGGAARSVHS
ncbi:MAG: hypothetical protein HUU20_27425 [Pirellulales bacterium]|nr:hypothetical protein [Pirellulales bacterium]